MRKHPRLLVFDWDGTLADSVGTIVRSIERTLRATGREPPSEAAIRNIIGLSYRAGLAALYPEEDIDLLVNQCNSVAVRTGQNEVSLFEGAEQTLLELIDHGYWLAIATGNSRRGLDQALVSLNLTSIFLATRTADEGRSKPHPDMLHSILDELGVEASEALVIGDTSFDMQMAANAGVCSVGVCCGVHSHLELEETALPVQIFDNVTSLPGFLHKHKRTPTG